MAAKASTKGKTGEQQVATILRAQIDRFLQNNPGLDSSVVSQLAKVVQRNLNQSSSGGGDINLFGLSIEVKRQEGLSVNTWWAQAVASAARNNDTPVLMFRQNHKAWRIMLNGALLFNNNCSMQFARVEIELDDFTEWFYNWASCKINEGLIDRV
jgi:hypothetical protein